MATTDVNAPVENPPPTPGPAKTHAVRYAVLVAVGVLLSLFGLTLTGATAPLGAALFQQRNGGYVTTPVERYAVDTYAITSQQFDVVIDQGLPGQTSSAASFLLKATGATPGADIFIGVGPQADVATYLATVEHSELTQIRFNPFAASYRTVAGSDPPAPPATQDFWAVSAQGPGSQQIKSDLRNGNWAMVIMNADGTRPVAVDLQAGVRSELLAPVTLGTLMAGLLLLALGVLLLVASASGLGRPHRNTALVSAPNDLARTRTPVLTALTTAVYPARLSGELDPQLSRWMWLVKWFLAIPHFIVLAFLWFAFVVTTVFAGFAILFTGRYPRSIFDFNVGVLRWSWRVAFYSYAVVGTDRYPPFTLARTDYPADFTVDYPEHLSRGLVLIKSWLLAIPHLLIIGVVTTNLPAWWTTRDDLAAGAQTTAGFSILGLLVFVAACVLLITRHYPRTLFDLILGMNRWGYRVITYVACLRDEYPPFRLDQGAHDPGDPGTGNIASAPEPMNTAV